jgi:hypothetical protein
VSRLRPSMGKAMMLIHEGNEYCFGIGDNVQQWKVSPQMAVSTLF